MKTKKSKKADLKRLQPIFLQIGFITAIGLVIIVLNYTISDKKELMDLGGIEKYEFEEELIPVTLRKKEVPPPPEILAEAIKLVIVEDDNDIIDDFNFDNEAFEDVPTFTPVAMDDYEEEEEEILDIPDIKPDFPGGYNALIKYLSNNIKYPKAAAQNSIEGKVFVVFVVSKYGKIKDVKIARSPDKLLESEAMRVVENMPDWSPGIKDGIPVNTRFYLPIKFQLN